MLLKTALCAAERRETCDSETRYTSVTPVEPSVSLECAEPAGTERQVAALKLCACAGETCGKAGCKETAEEVAAMLKELQATGTWQTNQLTLTKFPPRNEKISFLCVKNQAVTCRMVVDISKDAETCAEQDRRAPELNLTLAEKKTVYFRCSSNGTLDPASASQAYNGDCHGSAKALPNGVVGRQNPTKTAYSLTLQSALQTAEIFWYKCAASTNGRGGPANCVIKIMTQTTTQPSTQTTQATTPAPGDNRTTSGTLVSKSPKSAGLRHCSCNVKARVRASVSF